MTATAPAALEPPESNRWTARLIRRATRGHKAALALGDQAVVSLGNFVTSLTLARELPRVYGADEYGAFAMMLETMLLLNQVQTALVTYPLSVRGAVMTDDELRRLATGSLALTVVLLVPLAAIMFAVGGVVQHVELGLWAAIAMVLWQGQETLRRALISHLRYRHAIISDAVSFLGQAGAIVGLALAGELSLRTTFIAMAATSAVSMLVQLLQVRPRRIGLADLYPMAAEFWRFGRWMLFSGTIGILASHAYLWTLKIAHGLDQVGAMQALISILKVTNPLLLGICGLIIPLVSRLHGEHGVRAAMKVGVRYGGLGLVLLAPFYLLLLIAPQWTATLILGAHNPFVVLTDELRLIVFGYGMMYVAGILGTVLNALEKGRHNLVAQGVNLTATLAVGVPLTIAFGLPGALWGGLLTVTILTIVLTYFLSRLK